MNKIKGKNFLDMIPMKNQGLKTEKNQEGFIQIVIERKGILDRLVRLFIKTPTTMKVDFDAIGSSVWNLIDDKRTMEEMGRALKKEFGKEIEPIYERLASHMNILKNNKFIIIKKGQ